VQEAGNRQLDALLAGGDSPLQGAGVAEMEVDPLLANDLLDVYDRLAVPADLTLHASIISKMARKSSP
jgi:hypothetical protein